MINQPSIPKFIYLLHHFQILLKESSNLKQRVYIPKTPFIFHISHLFFIQIKRSLKL